jgi:hypothetical protein
MSPHGTHAFVVGILLSTVLCLLSATQIAKEISQVGCVLTIDLALTVPFLSQGAKTTHDFQVDPSPETVAALNSGLLRIRYP